MKKSIPNSCSLITGNWSLVAGCLPLALAVFLLPAASARAVVVSTYAFNSGMNCYGVWKLPDTSTGTLPAGYTPIPGEDVTYQPAASSPSYTNNGDGTTTDNVTGLMWISNSGAKTYTWANALSSCAVNMNGSSGYANHKDWRLPNVRELMSIVDYGTANAPYINTTAFPGTKSNYYWTSTTYVLGANSTTQAWSVNFADGGDYFFVQSNVYPVRCVRGGL